MTFTVGTDCYMVTNLGTNRARPNGRLLTARARVVKVLKREIVIELINHPNKHLPRRFRLETLRPIGAPNSDTSLQRCCPEPDVLEWAAWEPEAKALRALRDAEQRAARRAKAWVINKRDTLSASIITPGGQGIWLTAAETPLLEETLSILGDGLGDRGRILIDETKDPIDESGQ